LLLTLLSISPDADNKGVLVRASAIAFDVSGFSDDADAEELRKFHGRILQLEATAYPTRIDGITFYNVRRRAKVGYDYTAPNEQPHYILAELEVTPRDTLEVRLVRLVDGRAGGRAIRQRTVKSPGDFNYAIVEAPTERLVEALQQADLLRFAIGPFRRVTSDLTATGLETQLSTWPRTTRFLPRLYALARVSNGLAQVGLAAPALQCARLALEIEAGAASDPVPPSLGDVLPDWIEAMGLVAQAQWIAGETSSARATLDRVQSKPGFRPRLASPAYVGALAMVGRMPEALTLARNLKDASRRGAALVAIAIVEAERGDLGAALETVRQAASVQSALKLVEALVERGDLTGARAVLRLAVELADDDREALLSVARQQFEVGDADTARETARTAAGAPTPARGLTAPAAAHHSDAMERLGIAELQAEIGDLEGARRTFELVSGTLGGDRSAYFQSSLDRVIALQVRLGDRTEAQRTLQRAVASGEATLIARAYAASGDVEAAIDRAAGQAAFVLYDIADERRRAGDAAGASKILKLAFAKRRSEIDAQLRAKEGERQSTDNDLYVDALKRAEQHARAVDREASAHFFKLAKELARSRAAEDYEAVGLAIKVAEAERRAGDVDGARATWLEARGLAQRVPESDELAEAYALPLLLNLPEIPASTEKK
jgi:hypothetical protein